MKKALFLMLVLVLVASALPVVAQDGMPAIDCLTDETATVVVSVGSVGKDIEFGQRAADEFMAACPNITVQIYSLPESATDILGYYLQQFEAQSSEIDVFQFDVIWPGILAEHMLNMYDYISEDALADYFPAIVENNTVDGNLTGIPWFNDAPMLYYRTDLLDEYGVEVPQTWEELAVAAQTIQDGERAKGNADFWGYVWQGNAYEGLTCDGLEWIYTEAGSTIVDREGNITVNNAAVAHALDRAATWVGTISPEGVTSYQEEDSRAVWQAGNAAFMRNWPYAYSLGQGEDSAVAGIFNVALLPTGAADLRAATQGGWQLGVSKYSQNPTAAAAVAIYFSSPYVQKYRSLEGSYLPTAMSLYSDADLLDANPYYAELFPVLSNTVTRPSTVTGVLYNQVSTAFFTAAHSVLVGDQDGATAMELLELDLQDILGQ
ncbi:MAG: ABC transporter substrate-binding protein [Anaerolineaceae bacterium]|nr:ABC transporter substrate-binding protein [Anaerolineaceae bacterium]